jgi:hypothetical protein
MNLRQDGNKGLEIGTLKSHHDFRLRTSVYTSQPHDRLNVYFPVWEY